MGRTVAYKSALPILILILSLGIAACGGGGGDGPPPEPVEPTVPDETFSIGGSVSGLVGGGLVLHNAGTDLAVAADGNFTFPASLVDGTDYDITVSVQPDNPAQICAITNGSGTIAGADVTDVDVACASTFQFLSSVPADGIEQVTRAVQPSLIFSAPLNAGTAGGNVSLASAAGDVTIDVQVGGPMLTLLPQASLLPLTEYTISVSTGLLSEADEVLPEPVTSRFTTRDGMWLPQESILDPSATSGDLRLAGDAEGNLLVFWTVGGLGNRSLWSRYRGADEDDWTDALLISGVVDDHQLVSLQVAFDGDGAAIIVWPLAQNIGDDLQLWTSRFDLLTGVWSAASPIDTGIVPVEAFRLAGNDQGTVMLVWQQYTGLGAEVAEVLASRYLPGGVWSAPELIDAIDRFPPLTVVDAELGLAVDDDDHAIVTWQRRENDILTIPEAYASHYEPGAGWGPAEMLSGGLASFMGRPEIAMNANGDGIAVWRAVSQFGTAGLYASRYVRGTGWSAAEVVDATRVSEETPQVAIDASGVAIMVWPGVESGNGVVFASRRVPGAGWGLAEPISASGLGNAFHPRAAFDATGNALVAWQQLEMTMPLQYGIWSNRYTPDGGWGGAEQIGDLADWIQSDGPLLLVRPNGDADALWVEVEAGYRVWRAHFE